MRQNQGSRPHAALMGPRRQDDTGLIDLVGSLDDRDAYRETEAKRLFLHVRHGHCNSPIAGCTRIERGGELSLPP